MIPVIKFNNVSFSYGDADVLQDVSFSLAKGDKISIIGSNGAGKSTTLKISTGLLKPKSGTVHVLGDSPEKREIKRKFGYLPEDASPYRLLSVQENIQYSALLRGVDDIVSSTEKMIDLFDLSHLRLSKAYTLSRGNTQRLALAMVFVHDPEILIMDEPLNYLDLNVQETVVKLVRKTEATVLLSTHVVSTASRLTDRIMILSAGMIKWAGTIDEIETDMDSGETVEARLGRMM
ncbi:MAG: ABC transporter ATP-binding protein [Thermoplasmataceae archaeon]